MSKSTIIKKLQQMNWLDKYWRVKDFIILESDDKIIFSYNHGDMGLIDKVIYYKENSYAQVYELNNYYGSTDLVVGLYI